MSVNAEARNGWQLPDSKYTSIQAIGDVKHSMFECNAQCKEHATAELKLITNPLSRVFCRFIVGKPLTAPIESLGGANTGYEAQDM